MLALMVWVYDQPIKGNILKLSSIVEPRRAFEDYQIGEEVRARCHGFGIVPGVIGKIVDESGRKELENILKGDAFNEMVNEICEARGQSSASNVATEQKENAPQAQPLKEPNVTKQGGRPKKKKEGKENAAPTQAVLQKAASELELTELQNTMSSKEKDTHSLDPPARQASFEPPVRESSFVPPVRESSFEPPVRESSSVRESSFVPPVRESSLEMPLRQSLDLINNTEPPSKVPRYQEPVPVVPAPVENYPLPIHVPAVNGYMEQQVYALQQELYQANSKISMLESNYAWLYNYVQQMQMTNSEKPDKGQRTSTAAASPSPACPSSAQDPVDNPDWSSNSADSEEMIGGFTKSQLKSKVAGVTSYSRMAIALFRMLYAEDEFVGKSLTGAVSKSGEKRPAVDQERLNGIYKIIAENFAHVTPVMVREKLRDILKPSRANRTPKK